MRTRPTELIRGSLAATLTLVVAGAALVSNDTDTEGDSLSVTGVSGATGGSAVLAAGDVTFTPDANLCGNNVAGFNYTVDDGNGGTDTGTVTYEGETIPVPADKPTLSQLADSTGGTFHVAASAQELQSVYANLGSQVGYTTQHRDISWRFLTVGVLLTMAAAGASLLWAGRLV